VRAYLPEYRLESPRGLRTALELMADTSEGWKPFAGGTDLMVLLDAGKLPHRSFVNIWKLPELTGIEVTPDYVTLGALTTYTELRRHETLRSEFPLLCRAAAETGGIATQNRGTLGGNVANGSPAADSPPALLVYDAELELVSAQGQRWRPVHGFYSGYKLMDLRGGELIRRFRLPRSRKDWTQHYRKVGTRRAQAISKVCFAAAANMDDKRIADIRLAFGSIAPTVFRATATEQSLRGETISPALLQAAREMLAVEITPIDDIRSTARYRAHVALNLLSEFLEALPSR
jgi:CO/xanthine dehydrogenase FAD-binding subunit